ncbi:MAG: hypothetical protein GY786_14775 [Proteobacteria bacterium]|nr:hypothetical protein [Pseudomonadota bacterium]
MKIIMIVCCMLISLSTNAGEIKNRLQTVFYQNDINEMNQIMSDLEKRKKDWQNTYFIAFTQVHLGRVKIDDFPEQSLEHLQIAEALLDGLIEQKPDSFDAWILKVSAKGLMVGASGGSKFWKGIQAGNALDRAKELKPEHPQVRFENAIGLIFAPSWWGGDLDEAAVLLKQNLKGTFHFPDWIPNTRAHADHHAWLAYIALEQKRLKDARFYLDKALVYQQNYDFVQGELEEKYQQLSNEIL